MCAAGRGGVWVCPRPLLAAKDYLAVIRGLPHSEALAHCVELGVAVPPDAGREAVVELLIAEYRCAAVPDCNSGHRLGACRLELLCP